MKLTVNGRTLDVSAPESEPLLWVLRDDLGLTGTKPGCDVGACGSCTVLIEGRPTFACRTPVGEAIGHEIRTIEGLAAQSPSGDERLHPVQQAFLDEQALQCGWCAAGQLLTAAALLETRPDPTEGQIIEAMDTALCRCGTYSRIKAAVVRAAAYGRASHDGEGGR